VFLKFKPQEKFDYQFKMEPNHPAGTYWYHAHLHGSTALQVPNGMAGPLIVEGSRTPQVKNCKVTSTGDMDILWKEKTVTRTKTSCCSSKSNIAVATPILISHSLFPITVKV